MGTATCDKPRPADVAHAPRGEFVRGLAVPVLVVLLLAWNPSTPQAQAVDSSFWCMEPGARVFAIARSGNTIYVGGNFSTVGPATGGGVPIEPLTAAPRHGFPKVAGKVNAVVADGRGGWYIGGLFTAVGGLPRENLAYITAAGMVGTWSPGTDDEVHALALQGQVLYAGGKFTSVAGLERGYLAALSTDDGAPTAWNPAADHWVMTLLADGPVVYAGGLFTAIGGHARNYVAALDSSSGQATTWDAGIEVVDGIAQRVFALALSDTTLFVGGRFLSVRGTARRQLAAVSTVSGTLLAWDAGVERRPDFIFDGGPRVSALLIRDSTLYVAGSFKVIGGANRQGLAALNLATAQATSWDPRATRDFVAGAYFNALVPSGDTLFVAGEADSLGGAPSSYLAALDLRTGARHVWDPRPNWEVSTLALAGGTLFAGGAFTSVGPWVRRHDLAAFDATTGEVTSWAPEPDYIVQDIVVRGSTVYVGGSFSFVGGQPRAGIAALDAATGIATPWNPGVNGTVYSLAPWGSTVLVGGWFNTAGGQPRSNIAAVDTATGLATPWNPGANDIVYTVVPGDSVIYVGGWFGSIGGQVRATLAALDPATGLATPWAPHTDGIVNEIAVLDGTIYVGGEFNFVNGQQRDGIAALDGSGGLTPWAANASRRILALAAGDSTIYVGGGFSFVGGEERFCIAALDARTGDLRDWYPAPDGVVWSVVATDGVVYVGGAFSRMGRWPQAGFAVASSADRTAPTPAPAGLVTRCVPNPTYASALIQFGLHRPASVTLTLFDLQGRVITRVLSSAWRGSGYHEVPISTNGLRAGCYLYRLEADGLAVTRKLVVVR